MSRFYNNQQHIGGKYCTDTAPLDDRTVVQTQADLFSAETWADRGLYSGMIVAVIRDGANNGIYFLTKASDFNKQLWDTSQVNYGTSGHGWMRVGFIVLDKQVDNESNAPGSFSGTGTPTDPYYVSSINGGTF